MKIPKLNDKLKIVNQMQVIQNKAHQICQINTIQTQSIIPQKVLQIFENDEFTLQELIELIFEQQDRAYFNNYYSQNDIHDIQEQGSGVNNKQYKTEQADKKESEDSVSYYTEKNNLIINIKQLEDSDLKYTQLKIGFYILKNNNSLIDFNSQSFVLIEIFDQASFTTNLFEQDISEYKNRMLASISHELRTPLNCSIQMLQLLSERLNQICHIYDTDSELSEVNTGLVRPALLSNKLLLNIINDILDYGQINTGNFKLVFTSFNLYEVVKECVELMFFQAAQKDLTLEVQFDENLPEYINSDSNRLRQVLLNLLSNSLKFTEQGSINILVMCINDDLIRIDVKDTGCGIPEQNLSKVLESFGNKSKQKFLNTQGAGLGLSIANNLAMGLGGNKRIEISSQLNKGTCFTFYVLNRALNKKACEYKLKDLFNRKIIKWETLSQCFDNQSIPKVSSFNAVKFTHSMSSKLKTLKLNQCGTLNTQVSQVENNLEQHGSSMINNNEIIVRKVENPNISEESNEIQSNLITFTFKPQQLQTLQQKILTQSFNQIPNLMPHSNHSQFDILQKQILSAPKQFRNNSSVEEHIQFQSEQHILDQNDNIQKRFSDKSRNQKHVLQINSLSGLNAKQESCQVIEEQTSRETILNVQERSIYNASKNREFQSDYKLNQDQNIQDQNNFDQNMLRSENTLLIHSIRHQPVYDNNDFTLASSSKANDQISEYSKSGSGDISNQYKTINSPKSAKEKRYIQSKFNKSKNSYQVNEYSSSSQNQDNSQKSYDTNINSPTQLGRPIMIQLLKQINQNNKCDCFQILVVDDNDFNLYALTMKLQSYHLRVDKASSGQSAIDKVQAMHNSTCCKKYKAILMDIDMPKKDGHQTTVEILYFYKSIKVRPPLISACSAYVQESEKKKAKLSGMQYYITKPIQTNQLESFLLQVFQDQL